METIKKVRKICKIKQTDMANMIGIEQSNYCKMENGILIPRNISSIKKKCENILLPYLEFIIESKDYELRQLKIAYTSFKNETIISNFTNKLANNSIDLDSDISRIVDEDFEDLI